MATDQASASTLPLETRFSRTAPGQLWQVPVFLLGLAAVTGVWAGRPYWHDAEARQLDRDLEEVRWALDERRPNLDAILSRAERALEHINRSPARAGEAHFLLGSCFAQRAAGGAGEQSIHAWQQARLHLEEAERLGVPSSDLPKLSFRLGTAYAHLNVNTEKAIAYLRRSDEGGPDEAADRYALLAEACLKLPTPDVQAALDYTQKQLALPAADDALLAPARLRCGELLLRLQRRDEAHQVLARIKPGAPPSIVFRAQYLQAKSYQEEG
ncbi:MAG TPA: hypothetical protein VKI65_16300, partial [Gemmataceae bacterium]|nr:hypothetical protein [Gemmataceae bacterium]